MENQEITNFFGLISFWKLLEILLEIFSREVTPFDIISHIATVSHVTSCDKL